MTEENTSLDRLHDLALPPEVSWWPLAPGWVVVAGLLIILAILGLWRAWKRWQADAYRREALRELDSARDAAAIAELLRRTALVSASRTVVAEKTGAAWLDWLAAQCPEPMPGAVRDHLYTGVYGNQPGAADIALLRDYAARWIASHRIILNPSEEGAC